MSNNDRLALWLQGAMSMIGNRQPTDLEWQMLKEKVDEVVAKQVADRLAYAPAPAQPLKPYPYPLDGYFYGSPQLGGRSDTI